MSDDTIRGHDAIIERADALFHSFPIPPGVTLQIPPPSSTALDITFEEFVPGRSLTATVLASPKYANAVGLLQGGFLTAMFDNLIGPLSYMTAQTPTTTLELTTHFLRPVFAGEELKMVAEMRKAGRTAVFLGAEARNRDGKLVATAVSTVQVLAMPGR